MFRFEKKYGSWYCMYGDQISYMTDELAFGFSNNPDGAVLHKHGSLKSVEKWILDAKKKLNENTEFLSEEQKEIAKQMADQLTIISSTLWDVEEIQKFIDISGYIGIWYNRQFPSTQFITNK